MNFFSFNFALREYFFLYFARPLHKFSNGPSLNSIQGKNFFIHRQFIIGLQWTSIKSHLFKLRDRLLHFCLQRPNWKSSIFLYWFFFFIPMTMTFSMTPLLTFCEFGGGLEDQSEHKIFCHKWSTWCQQRKMSCFMTERDLRVRRFPFVKFSSAGSAPSLI